MNHPISCRRSSEVRWPDFSSQLSELIMDYYYYYSAGDISLLLRSIVVLKGAVLG
jgi:hypothetical protein